MSEESAALVWCPFPDKNSAREIAGLLLDEKLVACANIVGNIESLFEWDGERCSETEIGVLFKTTQSQCNTLIKRLGESHPYDSPAVIGWPCEYAHPSTLGWLIQQTGTETD